MNKVLFGGVFAIAMLVFCSCAGPARQLIDSPRYAGPDNTIVVGKIVLHPPMGEDEQEMSCITCEAFRNTIYLINNSELKQFNTNKLVDASMWGGRIEAKFGETFYALSPREPFYILKGMFFMRYTGKVIDVLYTPASLYVDIRDGDAAVYIGEIHYYRDEFFKLTKFVIKDNYENEKARFKKKFGDIKLVKRLVKEAK